MLTHRLRHRVTFQQKERVQDPATLEMMDTWASAQMQDGTALENVAAEVLTGAGREYIAAQGEQSETTARINLRWFSGLQTDWRILWDGRVFNIRGAVTDATGRREWRLSCEDGVNDG